MYTRTCQEERRRKRNEMKEEILNGKNKDNKYLEPVYSDNMPTLLDRQICSTSNVDRYFSFHFYCF